MGYQNKMGKLVICPTPLGNLGDVTKRTIEALSSCDVVCCEDTRVTGKLLSALGIEKRLERLDEAMLSHGAKQVIDRICSGEVIAYCSDAGMPGVSDPGQRLIDCAYNQGAPVEVLPGGTAVATAYVASGFTSQNFYFGSFFPRKEGERTTLLNSLKTLNCVLVFYESPNRIVSALNFIAESYPFRRVAVCRELTKLHEEVVRGLSGEVAEQFTKRQNSGGIKGEIVLVIDAPSQDELENDSQDALNGAHHRCDELKQLGTYSNKEIMKLLQKEFSISRNEAYALVHGA